VVTLNAFHFVPSVAFPSSFVRPKSTRVKRMTLGKFIITTVFVNRKIRQPGGNTGKDSSGRGDATAQMRALIRGNSLCGLGNYLYVTEFLFKKLVVAQMVFYNTQRS
jgi:hypothetical protein